MTTNLLTQLSNDFFQNSLDSSPTSAIMRGHKAYFEKLEELTDETFNKETKVVDGFISRLENIDQKHFITQRKSNLWHARVCFKFK
jgi:uncharacterized protein (DUF885 family)